MRPVTAPQLVLYGRAGELLEAREQVPRGRWGTWLSKNFELSSATAYRYMKYAQKAEFIPGIKMEDIRKRSDAERRIGAYRPIREFTRRVQVDEFRCAGPSCLRTNPEVRPRRVARLKDS